MSPRPNGTGKDKVLLYGAPWNPAAGDSCEFETLSVYQRQVVEQHRNAGTLTHLDVLLDAVFNLATAEGDEQVANRLDDVWGALSDWQEDVA